MIPVFWIFDTRVILKSGVGLDVQAVYYICKLTIQSICN